MGAGIGGSGHVPAVAHGVGAGCSVGVSRRSNLAPLLSRNMNVPKPPNPNRISNAKSRLKKFFTPERLARVWDGVERTYPEIVPERWKRAA